MNDRQVDILCPNHHRCAHIVKSCVWAGMKTGEIEAWASGHLPDDFCEKYLDRAIQGAQAALDYERNDPACRARREAFRECARNWDGPGNLLLGEFGRWWSKNKEEYIEEFKSREAAADFA